MRIIPIDEFRSRDHLIRPPFASWAGWTSLQRDPAEDYQYVKGMFAGKRVHEDDFLFFANFQEQDGLFLDIGANMGFSAISFRNINPDMTILSLEMIPFLGPILELVKDDVPKFSYVMSGVADVEASTIMYIPVSAAPINWYPASFGCK